VDNNETISLGMESDPIVVATDWSPMGLSRTHDCLLAVLDSYRRVSVWEASGVADNWIQVRSPELIYIDE
jgi:Transcription factor IIIC subunit delta bet-propeller domain